MHKITDDDIQKYNISIKSSNPEDLLKEKYPFFICRNTYRKLKDSENNWIKSVEIVFSEIICFLMDIGYEDSWIFLFMSGSSIGREFSNGDYAWQKLSDESKMKIIDFNRWLHKQRAMETKAKFHANLPDYMKEDSDQNNPKPELPDDHPLRDPYVLINVDKELDLRIVREKRNRLVVFICAISAFLCEKPLGAAGLGPSSVGKNMVFDTVLKHIPEKEADNEKNPKAGWFLCNNIKEAALFRLNPEFINHTVVYLGETPDKPSETHLELMGFLRQLQSEGKIAKTLSEQVMDKEGVKNWKSTTYKLEAEVSYFALSIHGFEEQFGNRQIPLSFDESEEQTNRIGNWKAEIEQYKTVKYEVSVRNTKSEYIEKVIDGIGKSWFEQYKEYTFVNPYANHVKYILQRMYSGSIQYRRVINYVFRFIETITRLHTFNRVIEFTEFGKETYQIVATSEDNLIGLYLLWPSLEQAIKHLTREDKDILEKMKDVFSEGIEIKLIKNADWETGEWFSANAMGRTINKGTTSIRDSCKKLYKAGYLNSKAGNKKGSWFKYSILKTPLASNPIRPSSLLPFFCPVDSPVCLLSLVSENSYSMIGLNFPLLFALFGHTNFLLGTHYIRVQLIYKYIVYGSIETFSSELKDILEEDFIEINAKNKGVYHSGGISVTSKRGMQGMVKLITEYKQEDRSLESDAKPTLKKSSSIHKNLSNVGMIIEQVVLQYQNADAMHSGMEKQEIIQGVNQNGWGGTDEAIEKEINQMISDNILYEARPDKLRIMT